MRTRLACGLAAVLALSASGSAQSGNRQWLIEKTDGVWEVRDAAQKDVTQKVRRIAPKYDVLIAGSQVRCVAQPCVLEYSTDGGPSKPLFAPTPPLSRWTVVPPPKDPPVARSATELQQIIGTIGVRGGADKAGPACGGDLSLTVPTCNDTITPADFKVQWTPRPSEAGRVLTLLVGGADSTQKRRWNSIPSDGGAFRSDTLSDFLKDLQLPDRATDVTVRLMRTESVDAVRLIRLPSKADSGELERRLQTYSRLAELPRQLATMEEMLKLGMWSSAALVSRDVLRNAPESLELKKYALIGLCGSDFADETARLRSELRDAGVSGICEAEQPSR